MDQGEQLAADYRSGKRDVKQLTALFDACFRIQREASEAAGRHVPLVVENVRGAIPWVGRSRWNFGSFHLWGDVPALMPMSKAIKVPGFRFDGSGRSFQSHSVEATGVKVPGLDWNGHKRGDPDYKGQGFNTHADRRVRQNVEGIKEGGRWFGKYDDRPACGEGPSFRPATRDTLMRQHSSKSNARKHASAMIAKIPLPLSRHIARTYYPHG